MADARYEATTNYRRRLQRQGMVRLEVHVRKADAPLVRDVAKALSDPERAADVRSLLREHLGAGTARGFKALLAAAPLEGIDLRRDRDLGRDVEL